MTAETVQHPSSERGRRHKWHDPVTVPYGPRGCEQTERACELCKLVKVTVHPPQGLPWREWREGVAQVRLERTPPCRERRLA